MNVLSKEEAKLEDMKSGADKVSSVVLAAIDGATQQIVGQLDGLVKEIEALKSRVIEKGGIAKAMITDHFALGAEALRHSDAIRARLTEIEEVSAAATNGAGTSSEVRDGS